MNTSRMLENVAFWLSMTFAAGNAAAVETPYFGTISGTATSVPIDAINPGDGVKAILGKATILTQGLGQVTAHVFVEDIPAVIPSGTCQAGTDAEISLGVVQGVHRFENGDLLYLKADSRTGCFDIDTLTFTAHQSGKITGGTGQFSQATGSWEIEDTVNVLTIDRAGQLFGGFIANFRGTIVTPAPIHIGKH